MSGLHGSFYTSALSNLPLIARKRVTEVVKGTKGTFVYVLVYMCAYIKVYVCFSKRDVIFLTL